MKKKRLLVIFLLTLLLMGCGEETENRTDMTEGTIEFEEEKDSGIFIDSAYETYQMQVPTEQVISENNNELYTQLRLLSHVVQYSDEPDAAIEATDLIDMYAEIKNNYFTVSKYFSRGYWYWGEEMGWIPNVEIENEWSADISGFSNTYWKLPEGGESHYNYAYMFDVEDVDCNTKPIEVYFHFGDVYVPGENVGVIEESWELYAAMTNGEIVLKYRDKIIKMPLELQDVTSYSYHDPSVYLYEDGSIQFMLYAPETGAKQSVRYMQKYEDGSNKQYNPSQGYFLQAISEEEYKNAVGQSGSIESVPVDGEAISVESEENEELKVMPDNIYGTYSFDSGVGAVVKGEVSVATDTGESYIYLGALYSDSNHYSNEILGTLVHVSDNVYYVKDECYGIAEAEITFTNGGMKVEMLNTDTDKYDILEGQYMMTSEIEWNQVG